MVYPLNHSTCSLCRILMNFFVFFFLDHVFIQYLNIKQTKKTISKIQKEKHTHTYIHTILFSIKVFFSSEISENMKNYTLK